MRAFLSSVFFWGKVLIFFRFRLAIYGCPAQILLIMWPEERCLYGILN